MAKLDSIGGGTVWDKGGGHRLKEPNLGYPQILFFFSSDLGHLFFVKSLDTVNIFFNKKKLRNFSLPLNAWLTLADSPVILDRLSVSIKSRLNQALPIKYS